MHYGWDRMEQALMNSGADWNEDRSLSKKWNETKAEIELVDWIEAELNECKLRLADGLMIGLLDWIKCL